MGGGRGVEAECVVSVCRAMCGGEPAGERENTQQHRPLSHQKRGFLLSLSLLIQGPGGDDIFEVTDCRGTCLGLPLNYKPLLEE